MIDIKKYIKPILFFITLLLINPSIVPAQSKGTILLVPHDDRPTSGVLAAEAPEFLGYKIKMPPLDMLGGLKKQGKPEELAQWILKNSKDADGAVIAADSVVYGGLVASRKHQLSLEELEKRGEIFNQLKKNNPKLKVYAFSSLMRTPIGGAESGGEEPDYYMDYGSKIFRKSGLLDLVEIRALTDSERQELIKLEAEIPENIWEDWYGRRKKNLVITNTFLKMANSGVLDYYVIGKDDNAPLSATHRESRILKKSINEAGTGNTKLLSGIDEFAMLLAARAVNDIEGITPSIFVEYSNGPGCQVVPKFSDEPIGYSIMEELDIAGAREVQEAASADMVLMVNTDIRGRTGDGTPASGDHDPMYNDGCSRENTNEFLDAIQKHLAEGRRVAVADIAFANGADNALMNGLRDRDLLFKLWGYAGWNTATNSTGFAIGQGSLCYRLPKGVCNYMLMERYLDDWAYQSNVREAMCNQLPSWEYVFDLKDFEPQAVEISAKLIKAFAEANGLGLPWLDKLRFYFPWHRPFIGGIEIK